MISLRALSVLAAAILTVLFIVSNAGATRYESTNYTIDASVGNSFGGTGSSSSYELTSSGGESIIGNGAGGSYMLGQGYVAELEKSLQLTVQPSGQVAYYAFDEAGTTAFDSSANSNDKPLLNGPARVSGKVGQAISFNPAANQSLLLDNPPQLQTNDVTISAWVKTGQETGNLTIIQKAQNYFLYINFGKLRVYDWATATACQSTRSLSDDVWHHVAMSSTAGEADGTAMYIDGTKETDCTSTVVNNTNEVRIGNNSSNTQPFDGEIDELKIFNRKFSAYEVEAEYDAGQAGYAAGLAFPGAIISGSSQTTSAQAVVQTDAPGYNLTLAQSANLTSGAQTIPAIDTGTIASPVVWSEGSTKGLGFTLTSTNATVIPAKWNSGNAYARLPDVSTNFYTRTGYTGGQKDTVDIRYRLDVSSGQPSGDYTNVVTYTGVMTP